MDFGACDEVKRDCDNAKTGVVKDDDAGQEGYRQPRRKGQADHPVIKKESYQNKDGDILGKERVAPLLQLMCGYGREMSMYVSDLGVPNGESSKREEESPVREAREEGESNPQRRLKRDCRYPEHDVIKDLQRKGAQRKG